MPGSATVVILPLPDVYAVTGGGTYSAGGAGVPVGLAGSQTGITYRLIVGSDTIPDPSLPGVPGTGYPITFGNQTLAGTYVAYGTNDITGCVSMMSGSATVIIDPWPAVFNVTGGGPYCAGDTGVHIGLTGSETNVTYHLKLDGIQHADFPGDGNPMDFGLFQLAGLYTVTATNNTSLFTLPMTGSATVTINPLPDQYLLGPGGMQCAGTEIHLNGSDTGIRYTLYRGIDSVTTVQGVGNPGFLSFGNISAPGTYTAIAINNATGCDIPMIGNTTIVELPEIFTLIPSGILCAGQTLSLTGSQTGVSYQLRRDGLFNAGSPVAGTGAPISFGAQTIPGSYTVVATSDNAPFCAIQMNGTRLLYPMPVSYTIVPEGDTCAPLNIGLNGSQTGVTYYLLLNGSYPPIDTVAGTGSMILFDETSLPGEYTILAGNDYSLCDTLMNGSLTVHPFPIAYQVTPQGTVCAGAPVGVENSELFVSYQLILNDTMSVGSPVSGTGGPISFGSQQIPGKYTVIAVYTMAPTCSGMMSGSVILSPLPDIFNIIPAGNHCAGSIIGLASSQAGIKYKLILNNQVNNPIDSIIGTGNAISFGPQPLAGTYRILAFNDTTSCQQTMNDSVVLAPLPLFYTIVPTGYACEPHLIGLSLSETGVNYSLLKNGLPMIPPVIMPGTGNAITFGLQDRGTYTVSAAGVVSGCEAMMSDSVIIEPQPSVEAGADTVICSADSAHLHAVTLYNSIIQWNSNGDGVFTAPSSNSTSYVPGPNDKLTGLVMLSATVTGISTCAGVQNTDSLLLSIHPVPSAEAGPELWICSPDSAFPTGSATNYSAVVWTSSGDGIFLNTTTLSPVYIPGPADTTAGSAILTLTVTGSGGCSLKEASDQTLVHFAPLPVVNAGNDTSICAGTAMPLNAMALHYDTLLWETAGDGIFSDPHLLNPVYFPGTLDQSNGSVTLTLQASGNGFCTQEEVTDSLVLTIDPNPLANAGPDTIICANATYQPVSQAGHYTTVSWSTNGDGIFNDPSLLSPIYTPGPADTTSGSVILTLEISGSLSCLTATDSDEMTLQIAPMPVPGAGADSMVCAGLSHPLSGSALHASTVLWTTTGDGGFTDPSILNPVYNPGSLDMLNGSVNLVLSAWGVEQCFNGSRSDTMNLIVQPLPTGSISGSTTICQGDSATVSVHLTGVAPWNISYTNGFTTTSISGIASSPFTFKVSPLMTTTYLLTMVNDQHCSATSMTGAAVITVQLLPVSYNMTATGNGGYCEGDSGVVIGLEHSDTGIEYQLWFAGLPAGNLVAGTGGPIILGQKSSPGTYKVKARNLTTLCQTWMEDSVVVHVLPLPVVDYFADSACINAPTQFHLTGPDLLAITTWHWDFGDGNTAVYNYPFEPDHIYAANSTYTVILTATDTNGCVRIRTHQVTVDPLPVSFFTFTTPGCSGNPIHFTDLSYTQTSTYISRWDWSFGDGTDSTILWPDNPDVNHTYPGAGIYPVSLKVYTPEGCMHTVIRNVTVSSAPLANFIAPASCNHEPTQFTDLSQQNGGGNIIEWNWNFGDPASGINNTSTLQNPVHIYQIPGIYTVKLITMNVNGCTDTITKEINTQSRPTALFEAPDTCHGTLTQFTDLSVTTSGAIIEWDWDFGDNTAHSNQQHPAHLYNLPGTYQVTLQVKNSHQCLHDTTLSVTVIAAPTAAFTTNAPVCSGQPVYFYNQSITTHGQIVKWFWEFGDGSDTTIIYPGIPNVAHIYNGTGIIYLVRLTVTTSDSCTDVLEMPLNTLTSPLANFSAANTRCELTPLQFSDLSQLNGGPPIISWAWNFDDPASGISNISSQQNPLHSFTASGNYDVSLIVRNLNSCTDTIVKSISVNEIPESVFTHDTACLGELTHFTDQSVPNAGSLISWLWNFGDGTSGSTLPNPEHLFANPGTYTVTLTVTNSNLCTDISTAQIIVRPEPVSAFTFSTGNCTGSPVSFTNQSTTPQGYMVQWIWDFGDGNSVTVSFPNPPDVTHVYANSGSFNVILTVKNSDSCTDQAMHMVTVNANPLANFTSASGNCEMVPVDFTDLSQTNGGGPIVNWFWDFGDPASGTANQSTKQNPSHVYQLAGNYTVELIVKNVANCYDTIEHEVVVEDGPLTDFSADTVCRGTPTQFTDMSVATSGTIVAWNWDFGDGTPGSTQQNPTHLYAGAGTYTVTLVATSSEGCSHDTAHFVEVMEIPDAVFTYSGQCEDSPIQFTDLSTSVSGIIIAWYWDFGDGNTSTLQHPVHTYDTTGLFNVMLRVTNIWGCADSVTVPVMIRQRPQAAFTWYSVHCPAGEVAFTDHSTASGVPVTQWNWVFEPGFTSSLPDPVYNFSVSDTIYEVLLVVTDLNGCADTTTDSVVVKHAFEFTFSAESVCLGNPTGFAPVNLAPGDTLNDLTWKFGEPSSGSNNISHLYYPEHTYAEPGSYVVMLKAYNSDNCVDSVYREVVVKPLPIPDFAFVDAPRCDTTMLFTNLSLGNSAAIDTLIWQFGDGTDTLFYDSIPDSFIHQYPYFGTFQVRLTAVNSLGCRDSILRSVPVTCIRAGFTKADTFACQRAPVILTDTSAPVSLIDSWHWMFGDGTDTTYTTHCSTLQHQFQSTGPITITLVVASVSGTNVVTDTTRQSITIRPTPLPAFTAIPVCDGDSSRFFDQSDTSGVALLSRFWRFGDPEASPLDTSTALNPVYKYPYTRTYQSTLTLTNVLGCTDSVWKQVRVSKLPRASFQHSLACSRYPIIFGETSTAGDTILANFAWYMDDPAHPWDSLYGQEISYWYGKPGSHRVGLKVTDRSGCQDTTVRVVDLLPTPVSAFTLKENVDGQPGRIQFYNETEGAIAYQWNFGNGKTSIEEDPFVVYQEDGTYLISLVSWNEEGCYDTTRMSYEFTYQSLYIPNAFHPTSLIIDVRLFKPKGINLGSYHIQVFDKWGDMLWESSALDDLGRPIESWNGYFNGELLPQDTYMWKVSASFKNGKVWEGSNNGTGIISTMGTVVLIR